MNHMSHKDSAFKKPRVTRCHTLAVTQTQAYVFVIPNKTKIYTVSRLKKKKPTNHGRTREVKQSDLCESKKLPGLLSRRYTCPILISFPPGHSNPASTRQKQPSLLCGVGPIQPRLLATLPDT